MKITRFIFFVFALCACTGAQAQAPNAGTETKKEPVNQTDTHGNKHGMWYFYQPSRFGEESNSEFGHFDHGRKIGVWYKVNGEGELISVEMYKNNVLDGEVKYYDRGLLSCIGHYRGLNPKNEYDSIVVTDPTTGAEMLRIIPTDRGTLKHGLWNYYEPVTGKLIRQEDYQVDELVYKKEFLMSKEDSASYQKQVQNLPHNKKERYNPPVKPYSYLND